MKFTTAIAALSTGFAAGSGSAAAIGNETASVATAGLNTAAVEGGFAASCRDIQMVRIRRPLHDMWEIHGICPDNNDIEYKTTINLNLCLANDKGSMTWAKRGQFHQSCKGCAIKKITKKEVNFKCICLPAFDRGHVWSEINLNDGIRNEGATFWCGDEIGTRSAWRG
ncbi:hypothetical protein CMUS01_10310 [Colletotrichum musicola]|uniref:Cyanovirin-N domain-containing protein n=1 Tax=Colletotrichum musicola TaxID=2175873 RepID=A0A8H6K375_9PEZI|nr:hypothetical protein CMUS01_10310 [Colletotrichum musicola]